jgi:hypothetical protein
MGAFMYVGLVFIAVCLVTTPLVVLQLMRESLAEGSRFASSGSSRTSAGVASVRAPRVRLPGM